jgi:flagellar hook-associated protein FlgK
MAYYKQEGLDINDISLKSVVNIEYAKNKIKDPKERFNISFISTLKNLFNTITDNTIIFYLNKFINSYGDLYIKTSSKTAATAFALYNTKISENDKEFNDILSEYTNKLSQNISKQLKIDEEFINYLKIDVLRYYRIVLDIMKS